MGEILLAIFLVIGIIVLAEVDIGGLLSKVSYFFGIIGGILIAVFVIVKIIETVGDAIDSSSFMAARRAKERINRQKREYGKKLLEEKKRFKSKSINMKLEEEFVKDISSFELKNQVKNASSSAQSEKGFAELLGKHIDRIQQSDLPKDEKIALISKLMDKYK